MWASRGNLVVKLHRVRFGPVDLGSLNAGQHRALNGHEVQILKNQMAASRSNSLLTTDLSTQSKKQKIDTVTAKVTGSSDAADGSST
jgi:hypothetical protein